MSEAELHVLRARLQGGILNKARRGELQCPLPVGFVYNAEKQPILDPDKQVQESIQFFFQTFRRVGSACGVVKAFREKGLLFPRRLKKGPHKGDLVWGELPHSRTLHILHNPRYTGAFVYGRSRTRRKAEGGWSYTKLPREQWMLLQDTHPGYISWKQYEGTCNASVRMHKPTAQTAERVRPGRARRCCRASSFVVSAETA